MVEECCCCSVVAKRWRLFATNRKLPHNPILPNLSLQNKHNYIILLPNPPFFFSFSQTQHRRPAVSSFFLPPKPSFLLFLFLFSSSKKTRKKGKTQPVSSSSLAKPYWKTQTQTQNHILMPKNRL
jgi:hypothetical protein